MGAKLKKIKVLTEVPVPAVGLCAFSLGDDIREFVGSLLRSLLYAWRVVHPSDNTAGCVAMIADVCSSVLAPGKYGIFWEQLEPVSVLNLIPRGRI